MDEQNPAFSDDEILTPPVEEPKEYRPRPRHLVLAARVGLVIMIICVILYYYHIASGGVR